MSTTDPKHWPPQPWARTRALMRSDFARLRARIDRPSLGQRAYCFVQPGHVALWAYRLSHYLYRRGFRNTARLLTTLTLYLTQIDIPPTTVIGEACLLAHPPIVLSGRIGDRYTLWGDGGCGGGFGSEDVGAGPGLPVIGNDVVMAVRSMVLGPVRIGDGVGIGPGCNVMRDVPAGSTVAAPPCRISTPTRGGVPAADA